MEPRSGPSFLADSTTICTKNKPKAVTSEGEPPWKYLKTWSRRWKLNPRPADYEVYSCHVAACCSLRHLSASLRVNEPVGCSKARQRGAIRCGPLAPIPAPNMKRALTDRLLGSLRGAEKPYEVWDKAMPGLSVMVLPSGRRTLYVRYWLHGRYRRKKLGRYPGYKLKAARRDARKALAAADAGVDVQANRRGVAFVEVARLYIERHAKRELISWREYARVIERDLEPIHKRPFGAVKRRELVEVLRLVESRGTLRMRNRVASVLAGVYRWAIDEEVTEEIAGNPAADLPRRPEGKRERVLSEEEARAMWAYPFPPATRLALRMLLLTAQRSAAVCGAHWAEIDGNRWTVPAARMKGRKSKKRAHLVPLSGLAVANLPFRVSVSVVLFPGKSGPMVETSLAHAVSRAGFTWTPRDLRKTAATWMAKNGVDEDIIGRVLAHTPAGVTGRVYNLYAYEKEKRAALEVLAAAVQLALDS